MTPVCEDLSSTADYSHRLSKKLSSSPHSHNRMTSAILEDIVLHKTLEPPNFSWLEEGVLSACAFPDQVQHLQFLVSNKVTCLVSLTSERTLDRKHIPEEQLRIVWLPIRDYTPPTLEQVEQFIACVLETKAVNQATCVHCAHGLGRTGTMLACYFVQVSGMTAEAAIAHVRKLRPGSLETTEQELLVHQFHVQLQARSSGEK